MALSAPPLTERAAKAWRLLCLLAEHRRQGRLPAAPAGVRLRPSGGLQCLEVDASGVQAVLRPGGLTAPADAPPAVQALLALYGPLFAADRPSRLIAHLGQSVDGKIATPGGDSCYVTGPPNLVHLHRMRALSDAIVVGAGTACADRPRLTTRLVSGANPVRVIIDPERRVPADLPLFHDAAAPSLRVCARELRLSEEGEDVIGLERAAGGLNLPALVSTLRARGLRQLFIEGGGVTVSRFLEAGLLDRLQLTVAPLIIGEGRPALRLPAAERLSACRRPPARVYSLGDDVMWDFDLRAGQAAPDDAETEMLPRLMW